MKSVAAAIGLSVIACATGAAAAITTFHTTLRNPGPTDPPTAIAACGSPVGSGTFAYDDSSHSLTGNLTFTPAPATTAILYGPPSNYLHGLNCGGSPCSVSVQMLSTEEADLLASKDVAFLQSNGQPATMSGYIVNDDGGIDSCDLEVDAGTPMDGGTSSSDAATVPDASAPSDAAVADTGKPDELLEASCSASTGPRPKGVAPIVAFAALFLVARRRAKKLADRAHAK